MKLQNLLLLVVLIFSFTISGNTETSSCCKDPPQLVSVEFNSQIVENEYIVTFNGYYKHKARAGYINAALNGSGVRNWTILERHNPASDFPSDFDVVTIADTEKLNGLDALHLHPQIKHVTSQRMVHRTLKFTNETDPEKIFCVGGKIVLNLIHNALVISRVILLASYRTCPKSL